MSSNIFHLSSVIDHPSSSAIYHRSSFIFHHFSLIIYRVFSIISHLSSSSSPSWPPSHPLHLQPPAHHWLTRIILCSSAWQTGFHDLRKDAEAVFLWKNGGFLRWLKWKYPKIRCLYRKMLFKIDDFGDMMV